MDQSERDLIAALAPEIVFDQPHGARKSAQAYELALKIMHLTANESSDRLVICTALWRALAGFYARLALDAGDKPDVAGLALMETAYTAAEVAERLVAEELAERPQATFDHSR